MSKHTPGPWRVDHHMNVICGSGLVAFPCIKDGLPQEANAALIAAAPEILDSLQDLIGWVSGDNEEEMKAVNKARAAIAKATGK